MLGEAVGPHMGADGVQQRSEPVADQAVVLWLDQQLRALSSLHLRPGQTHKVIDIDIYDQSFTDFVF